MNQNPQTSGYKPVVFNEVTELAPSEQSPPAEHDIHTMYYNSANVFI